MAREHGAGRSRPSGTPPPRSEPQPLEHRLVAAPLRGGLDLQLEEDLMAEQRLDRGARPPADLAHHRAALADQDLLLALRLGVDPDVDAPVVDLDDPRRSRVPP